MKNFVEINNSDLSVIRTVFVPDDWAAPSHKYNKSTPTRFLEVVSEEMPAIDFLTTTTERKTKIEDDRYIYYYETKDKTKEEIGAAIMDYSDSLVSQKISVTKYIRLLTDSLMYEKKIRLKKPISAEEELEEQGRQKILGWVQNIENHRDELLARDDNQNIKDGWPVLATENRVKNDLSTK